jgi:hypothetical protein
LAFPEKHAQAIDSALSDKGIDALHAVRNILIHQAGRVDATYQKRQKHIPQLPKLEIGQPIKLDGELVRGLISPVIVASTRLTRAVDNWLETH